MRGAGEGARPIATCAARPSMRAVRRRVEPSGTQSLSPLLLVGSSMQRREHDPYPHSSDIVRSLPPLIRYCEMCGVNNNNNNNRRLVTLAEHTYGVEELFTVELIP